jgi:hypothetical protein
MSDSTETERLLRQIQRAAGLDPDGPRLTPMVRQQTRDALRRANDAATRDAMLRRALSETSP